jgi:capsular exopolysaccharide synthesis family protein
MNIAASMALKNAKVLMIDLDLRKASLSKSLDVNHTGVAAYLNGKVDEYQPYTQLVAENLYLLPVGTLPPNPTELLLSERFSTMLEQMRQEYDYVFIDCPPIDIVADSNIVTEFVDMTVLVMRSNLMSKDVLPVVDELYRSGKFKHMALILNAVELQYKKYGYGKAGYGYGYGYANDDQD